MGAAKNAIIKLNQRVELNSEILEKLKLDLYNTTTNLREHKEYVHRIDRTISTMAENTKRDTKRDGSDGHDDTNGFEHTKLLSRQTESNLEKTNAVVLKVHDVVETLKKDFAKHQKDLKLLIVKQEMFSSDLATTAQNLSSTDRKLSDLSVSKGIRLLIWRVLAVQSKISSTAPQKLVK